MDEMNNIMRTEGCKFYLSSIFLAITTYGVKKF
jgi:hypothetical protein